MRNVFEVGSAPLFCAASLISFFTPIHTLILIVAGFALVDMIITAIAVLESKGKKRKITLSDLALKQGIYNVFISTIVIALCWLLGTHVINMPELNLERIGAGFICVFELLIILKRATFLTKKSAYKHFDRFLKNRMHSLYFDEISKNKKREGN